MKPERIKALIDLMADSDLSELSLSEGDAQLRLLRDQGQVSADSPAAPTPPVLKQAAVTAAPAPVTTVGHEASASLYGVLHLTPAPDQPPFVEVGAAVEVGQTLAVVEAMKMFHPVKAEVAGTVTAILAASGEEVQAGQALIRIG
jgi:acetyl-CoA carboxylase biotin carboxyl carrier protein